MSETVSEVLGYKFNDEQWLAAALLHGSSGKSGFVNERLETLGDAVVTLVITDELMRRLPDADEGRITVAKSALVSSRTLGAAARESGLLKHATIGHKGRRPPARIAANIFEAVIGAIYLDGGLEPARRATLRLLGDRLQDPQFRAVDPKSRLQHLLQATRRLMPTYEVVGTGGPPHNRIFRVRVVIAGRAYPAAEGASKKAAETRAAALALRELAGEPEGRRSPPKPDANA